MWLKPSSATHHVYDPQSRLWLAEVSNPTLWLVAFFSQRHPPAPTFCFSDSRVLGTVIQKADGHHFPFQLRPCSEPSVPASSRASQGTRTRHSAARNSIIRASAGQPSPNNARLVKARLWRERPATLQRPRSFPLHLVSSHQKQGLGFHHVASPRLTTPCSRICVCQPAEGRAPSTGKPVHQKGTVGILAPETRNARSRVTSHVKAGKAGLQQLARALLCRNGAILVPFLGQHKHHSSLSGDREQGTFITRSSHCSRRLSTQHHSEM